MVMCLSCGKFVRAISDGDTVEPWRDECAECGGREFKDTESGRTIDTERAPSP